MRRDLTELTPESRQQHNCYKIYTWPELINNSGASGCQAPVSRRLLRLTTIRENISIRLVAVDHSLCKNKAKCLPCLVCSCFYRTNNKSSNFRKSDFPFQFVKNFDNPPGKIRQMIAKTLKYHDFILSPGHVKFSDARSFI